MRHLSHHRRHPVSIGFNAAPMFDMMFTLTIFFMLVCRLSSAQQIKMELPKPEQSKAQIARTPDRVVINCRMTDPGDPNGSLIYSIGPNKPQALHVIAERLASMKRGATDFAVVIRADKRLPYARIRALMRVIAQNDIEMLNVVAHVGEGP